MREILSFSTITQGYIQQESLSRNIGFRLVCSILFTLFIRHCTKWYTSLSFLTKCFEGENFSQEDRGKRLWITCGARNQLNFTWEKSSSSLINGKRWFKIMVNIILIEINSLLNYSQMNYIQLKRKLLMIQIYLYVSFS